MMDESLDFDVVGGKASYDQNEAMSGGLYLAPRNTSQNGVILPS